MDTNVLLMMILVSSLLLSTIVVLLIIRKQRARQREAFAQLPGELKELASGKKMAAEHEGTAYEVHYFAGSRNAPSRLTVSVACDSEGRFKITRESGFDRFFKRHGITNEVETLDKAFDDEYFIQSNTVDFVRQLFQPPEKRQAVRTIFELGHTIVEHDGKTTKATRSPFHLRDDVSFAFITGTVSGLRELSTDVPRVPQGPSTDLGAWRKKRAVAFAVPMLAFLVGMPLMLLGFVRYPPLDGFSVFLDSLQYSLPPLILFSWLAVKLLRGRSTSHHELIAVGISCIIALPLAGMGIETFLNGWLDTSPPSSHTVVVLDKSVSRSGKTRNYNLVLESWRPGRKTETLEVSASIYQSVVLNQTKVHVETRPGHFGFEWRVSYRVLQ